MELYYFSAFAENDSSAGPGGEQRRLCGLEHTHPGYAPAPDPAAIFSEGGEVINLHIEGSLTILAPGLKGYQYGNT